LVPTTHCPAFYDIVEIEVVKLDVVRVGGGGGRWR
jgi:hypothetical protein